MAGREIGNFARGFGRALTPKRSLLCDRFAYLGGGRGYGWRTRAYGDWNDDDREANAAADSGYPTLTGAEWDRRSNGLGRNIMHRDDCEGQCGLISRRSSRSPSPE